MKKYLFFVILVCFISPLTHALSNPYILDQATFVHADDTEKEKVIIALMELLADLEAKYKKDLKTSGYSFERFQNFQKTVENLTKFFMESAYADPGNPEFADFAKDFKTLLAEHEGTKEPKGCIYGGWVSRIVNGKCTHPMNLKDTDPVKVAYKKLGQKCKGGTSIMTCNPVVYGYQDNYTKSPLCVKTGIGSSGNLAHNTSYDCMRVSLELDKLPRERSPKTKERMDFLKAQMADPSNAASFKDIHENIFNACVCSSTSTINAKYKDYIMPHRTCFGLMNSVREIYNSCGDAVPKELGSLNDFYSFWTKNEFLGESKYYTGKLDPSSDEANTKFGTYYGDLIKQTQFKQYCDLLNAGLTCVANCTPDEKQANGKPKWKCEIIQFKRENEKVSNDLLYTLKPNEKIHSITNPEQKDIIVKGTSCPISLSNPDLKNSCQAECKLNDAKKWECTVKEFIHDDEDQLSALTEKVLTFDTEPGEKIIIQGKDCSITKVGLKNECSIKVEKDSENKIITATAEFKLLNKQEKPASFSWEPSPKAQDPKKNQATFDWDNSKEFTLNIIGIAKDAENEDAKFECPLTIPGNAQENTCSIAFTAPVDGKASAVVTFKGGAPDQKTEATWTGTPTTPEVDATDKNKVSVTWDGKSPLTLTATAKRQKLDKTEETATCEHKEPAAHKEDPNYVIEAEINNTTNISVVVNVTNITIENKDYTTAPAGYKVVWVRENTQGQEFEETPKKEEKKKEDKPKDGTIVDGQEPGDKPKEEEKKSEDEEPEVTAGTAGEGEKITVPRMEKDYDVVAQLKKGDEVVSSSEPLKIPKKPKSYGPVQTPQMPQRPPRMRNETWTEGKR